MSIPSKVKQITFNDWVSFLEGRKIDSVQTYYVTGKGVYVSAIVDGLFRAYLLNDVTLQATEIFAATNKLAIDSSGRITAIALGPITVNQGNAGAQGWKIGTNPINPISGRVTTSAGVATQLATGGALSNTGYVVRNLDATNSVDLGGSGVTTGNGYLLKAGEISPPIASLSSTYVTSVYAIDNGVNTVTLAWYAY